MPIRIFDSRLEGLRKMKPAPSKNNSEFNNKTPYGCSDLSVLIDAKLGRNQLPDLKRLQPENIEIIEA